MTRRRAEVEVPLVFDGLEPCLLHHPDQGMRIRDPGDPVLARVALDPRPDELGQATAAASRPGPEAAAPPDRGGDDRLAGAHRPKPPKGIELIPDMEQHRSAEDEVESA